jgi:hypothetical protein
MHVVCSEVVEARFTVIKVWSGRGRRRWLVEDDIIILVSSILTRLQMERSQSANPNKEQQLMGICLPQRLCGDRKQRSVLECMSRLHAGETACMN